MSIIKYLHVHVAFTLSADTEPPQPQFSMSQPGVLIGESVDFRCFVRVAINTQTQINFTHPADEVVFFQIGK